VTEPTGSAAASRVPDTDRLTAVLGDLLIARGLPRPVRITSRRAHAYASTFPSEVIEYEGTDGVTCLVHAKYQAGRAHADHGHRRDLAYEAAVYEELVCPVGLPTPQWLGVHREGNCDAWLFLEHLEHAVELDEAPRPAEALLAAARWIGTFHAWHDARPAPPVSLHLTRYDAPYYQGWVERTLAFAGPWHERLSWLAPLARRSEELLRELATVPVTVVHGEFTPSNVLFANGLAYPIDWESTAVGPGEIDAVCLIDKWPAAVSEQCIEEYAAARWPGEPASARSRGFDLARVYWDFRWLGDRPEWTSSEKVGPRFDHLRRAVERVSGRVA
jgi:aminoglycoside phosphotransferase (APT) family kinase protein